ncbi:MAG: hypothetical protein CVU56_18720 [Deltaproteobacteria bacterium HGW-Deltaproteobacteria-14]|nr:MAG: hypothetical protein CVU56_18720 [Deltaproteobacteria bacterium HGW-Deltaproteobacteria-14]
MIKLHKHLLVCDCEHCREMFPHDRHDAVWAAADPGGGARRAIGRVPIGADEAPLEFVLWVTADDRLAVDWPGFPGTRGAAVTLSGTAPDGAPVIVATRDPALGALSGEIPLRRALAERFTARCMEEYGLAPEGTADLVACERHGSGVAAMACRCVVESPEALDVTVLYGLDGDYPDVFCEACLARFARGEVDVCVTVCSRCQQLNIYRHRVIATSWYGA